MTEDLVYRLVEFLETASPVVWQAALRQAQVLGVANLLWFVVMTIGTVILARLSMICWRNCQAQERYQDDGWDIPAAICGIAAIVAGLAAVACLDSAMRYLLNPAYYALKSLVDLFPSG